MSWSPRSGGSGVRDGLQKREEQRGHLGRGRRLERVGAQFPDLVDHGRVEVADRGLARVGAPGDGIVRFLDGHEHVALIDRHLPEFHPLAADAHRQVSRG